jgi:hypothetical protein
MDLEAEPGALTAEEGEAMCQAVIREWKRRVNIRWPSAQSIRVDHWVRLIGGRNNKTLPGYLKKNDQIPTSISEFETNSISRPSTAAFEYSIIKKIKMFQTNKL